MLAVALSPDGQQLASGAEDGSLRLWDLATGAERRRLEGGGVARALAFNRDASLLASGSARLLGHEGWVWSVAFDPAGGRLASGGADGRVRLWDLHPLRLLNNGPASARRAALLAEALPRLWRLRL